MKRVTLLVSDEPDMGAGDDRIMPGDRRGWYGWHCTVETVEDVVELLAMSDRWRVTVRGNALELRGVANNTEMLRALSLALQPLPVVIVASPIETKDGAGSTTPLEQHR